MKRLLSGILAIVSMFTLCITTSATDQTINYDSTVNDEASTYSEVTVEAERAELYTVTLPKYVTLEVVDETAEYEYTLSVLGEIGEGNYVRVIPLTDATLANKKTASEIPLGVEQEKRRFAWDELSLTTPVETTGVYCAENLQPGEYVGNVRYLVTLDDGAKWISASCTTPALRVGVDVNDNGVIDVGEDLDGDGVLDVDEDTNADGILDTGEDIDGDGKLDIAEDTNGDGVLELTELDSVLGLHVTRGVALGHKYPENRSFECVCERCSTVCLAIATPEHLIEFANAVRSGNTYTGATVYLCNDLDLKGYDVPTIGTEVFNKVFQGTFDGCGYKIYNYKKQVTGSADNTDDCIIGLFANIEDVVTIKNVVMVNPVIEVDINGDEGSFYIGFIAGEKGTTGTAGGLYNCHIYNGVITITGAHGTSSDNLFVGGLVGSLGKNNTPMKNCSFTGQVNQLSTNWYRTFVGGLFSASTDSQTLQISNCFAATSITNNDPGRMGAVAPDYYITKTETLDATFTNVLYDRDLYTSNYGTGMTTAQMQSQESIDILNTDNELTWKLDMEGLNGGYPIITT